MARVEAGAEPWGADLLYRLLHHSVLLIRLFLLRPRRTESIDRSIEKHGGLRLVVNRIIVLQVSSPPLFYLLEEFS